MADFYGVLQGRGKGKTTRRGTKDSGLTATAASWQGCVRTTVRHGLDKDGHGKEVVYANVTLADWMGAGREALLYDGPIDGSALTPFEQLTKARTLMKRLIEAAQAGAPKNPRDYGQRFSPVLKEIGMFLGSKHRVRRIGPAVEETAEPQQLAAAPKPTRKRTAKKAAPVIPQTETAPITPAARRHK